MRGPAGVTPRRQEVIPRISEKEHVLKVNHPVRLGVTLASVQLGLAPL